uniref:hypothetical protein n=1 Tax=Streptomyces sp. CA-136453 TaxID=3240050 RepID=UPI003F4955EF
MDTITIPPTLRVRLNQAQLPPAPYLLAIYLTVDTDREGWRTCDEVARDTAMTTHQVRQAARALNEARLIDRCRRFVNANGRKTTATSYRLRKDGAR